MPRQDPREGLRGQMGRMRESVREEVAEMARETHRKANEASLAKLREQMARGAHEAGKGSRRRGGRRS